MRKLSFLILPALAIALSSVARTDPSPHGKDFKISCNVCHSSKGWKLDKEVYAYDHNTSAFPLSGQHTAIGCRSCHPTLVFGDAKTQCVDCHTDMHNQTVGPDCRRCHTPRSWIVENITQIHQQGRFPLMGAHTTTDCSGCHPSASLLRFEPLGVECFDCHKANYYATTQPNHVQGGYSTNCAECHSVNSIVWTSTNVNHSFFPLTQGHAIACNKCHTNGNFSNLSMECVSCHLGTYNSTNNPNHTALSFPTNCAECHTTNPGWTPASFDHSLFPLTLGHAISDCNKCHNGNYTATPTECVSCHLANYNGSTNPNHQNANIPTTCADCHSTNPGWKPASFAMHDQIFPIYTGKHAGAWTLCSDCHTNPSNYGTYTCIDCHAHNQTDMDSKHNGISGYAYNSPACLACHPAGNSGGFNHSTSNFPLTGAHSTTPCTSCHTNGFTTPPPTDCSGCHTPDYNQTLNPNHAAIGIPTTCTTCHTTVTGWKPATFPTHNNYYVLAGAHISIANNCGLCHNGNYNSTPNTCAGCHMTDYNQTNNPPHASAQFPTNCESCHNQSVWVPSTFNHDGQYFPIYSGKHAGQWTLCADCHTNPTNYAVFSCIDCHTHSQTTTNNQHSGVSGYSYNSQACFQCHPTGSAGGKMMIQRTIKQN